MYPDPIRGKEAGHCDDERLGNPRPSLSCRRRLPGSRTIPPAPTAGNRSRRAMSGRRIPGGGPVTTFFPNAGEAAAGFMQALAIWAYRTCGLSARSATSAAGRSGIASPRCAAFWMSPVRPAAPTRRSRGSGVSRQSPAGSVAYLANFERIPYIGSCPARTRSRPALAVPTLRSGSLYLSISNALPAGRKSAIGFGAKRTPAPWPPMRSDGGRPATRRPGVTNTRPVPGSGKGSGIRHLPRSRPA